MPDDIWRGAGNDWMPLPSRECANLKCRNYFLPRAEGDDYCSEACDLDDNPKLKAGKSQ